MKFYIVNLELEALDDMGIESQFITTNHIPVMATNDLEASKKAVVWLSDSGKAVENENLVIECKEISRKLIWKVSKVLNVSEDDFQIFLSLTQGVYKPNICK